MTGEPSKEASDTFAGIKVIVNPLLPRDSFMLVCNPRENETLKEYIERQGWAIVKNVGHRKKRKP